jgi:hypothetical protein
VPSKSSPSGDSASGPPPPLGSWRRMYALVIGVDLAIIVLLALFTRLFD